MGKLLTDQEKAKLCALAQRRELQEILFGMSTLEQALVLAAALRDATGEAWTIEADVRGGFTLHRA